MQRSFTRTQPFALTAEADSLIANGQRVNMKVKQTYVDAKHHEIKDPLEIVWIKVKAFSLFWGLAYNA